MSHERPTKPLSNAQRAAQESLVEDVAAKQAADEAAAKLTPSVIQGNKPVEQARAEAIAADAASSKSK